MGLTHNFGQKYEIFLYFVLYFKTHWNNVSLCSREKPILSKLEKPVWYRVINLEIFERG